MDASRKRQRDGGGGDGNDRDLQRVACPACRQDRAGYNLQRCLCCGNDFCTRPTCFPMHQLTVLDSTGHQCCLGSLRPCHHCGGFFCGGHNANGHTLTTSDSTGHPCCGAAIQACQHCGVNYCRGHNLAAHQGTHTDASGHTCCGASLQPCAHCGQNYCRADVLNGHQTATTDAAGDNCCFNSLQPCQHCGGGFCGAHSANDHLLTFSNDAAGDRCCAASQQECAHCHGKFCRTHNLLRLQEIVATGCSHNTCLDIAGSCTNCLKTFCAICKNTELKSCKADGATYCDACKPCEKCAVRKSASASGGNGSKSSAEATPKLSLARRDSQTVSNVNKQSLTILHLDVDQGACTLVLYTTSEGKPWTAVIDGGHGNPGRGQIERYLRALGRNKIDALFLSHHDADHADGLSDLLQHHTNFFSAKSSILYVPYESSSHSIKKYSEYVGIARKVPTHGETIKFDTIKDEDGFKITPYYGTKKLDENGRSLVLHISLGKFSYLTCGDLPTLQGEDDVAREVKAVDVLFCSHHGSYHSTSSAMLTAIEHPSIAVISAGRNGYGHPNPKTIQRFVDYRDRRPDLRLYLTGCQYNRKYINPNYYEKEFDNLTNTIDISLQQYDRSRNLETLKDLITALNDGLLFCEEEDLYKGDLDKLKETEDMSKLKNKLEQILKDWLEQKIPLSKSIAELLSDVNLTDESESVKAFVKQCYDKATEKKEVLPLIGVVSGTSHQMGPVGIRILPAPNDMYVDIGYCPEIEFCPSDISSWKWRHRWIRRKVDNKLIFFEEICETDEMIEDATPKLASGNQSPSTYKTWLNIRLDQRKAFSLSSRSERQPDTNVTYTCRQTGCCENGRRGGNSTRKATHMVLVSCEYCRQKGTAIAYHEACFRKLVLPGVKFNEWIDEKLEDKVGADDEDKPTSYMTNNYPYFKHRLVEIADNTGGEIKYQEANPHFHPLWESLIDLIDQREDTKIPVMIPAKFEACYFCATFRPVNILSAWQRGINELKLIAAIKARRLEFEGELLTVSTGFAIDDTFEDFYEKQCENNEFQNKLRKL